jgi:hypothetical protein
MNNWKELMDRISDLRTKVQHLTTSTKLHIAKRHCDKLRNLIPTERAPDLVNIEFDKRDRIIFKPPTSLPSKIEEFYDELEFIFYNLRSSIDSFLWEINLLLNLRHRSTNFRKFLKRLNKEYKNEEITKLLSDLQKESWFEYLSEIRNNLIHRLFSEVAISKDLKLYLPSKPKSGSFKLEKEFELLPCLDGLLGNVKDFLEKGYKILACMHITN